MSKPVVGIKVLIIGNAGCGKTYLGKKLSKQMSVPLFHIDNIWFKPGGYSKEYQRSAKEREEVMRDIMSNSSYIIEGASGITAKKFAKVATHLIFVKYAKDICLSSIKSRTLDAGQSSSKKETNWLYNFAKDYYSKTNTGSVSLHTHEEIVNSFKKSIYIITSRADADRLVI